MLSIRWHGRGGQGVWTASLILAKAAISEGKYAQSFPEFGPERMGAPVRSFTRISDRPISLHCAVYKPDTVVVLDPTLMKIEKVGEGLREGGTLIVNTRDRPEKLRGVPGAGGAKIWTVPATDIASKVLGKAITNTAMIGALIKATGAVKIQSVIGATRNQFAGKVAELNVEVVKRAYGEARK